MLNFINVNIYIKKGLLNSKRDGIDENFVFYISEPKQ